MSRLILRLMVSLAVALVMVTYNQPIRGQYPGHVITLDQ